MNKVIFHGGCHSCERQDRQPSGVNFCFDCQYFEADWSKPNLSDYIDPADCVRESVRLARSSKG